MARSKLIDRLLVSPEPSIRWKVWVRVRGEERGHPRVERLEQEVRRSPRVQALLSHVSAPRRDGTLRNVYYKWQGVHWALASLADLGYPRGEDTLRPLSDRVLKVWMRPGYARDRVVPERGADPGLSGVPFLRGRARRCASQQGNALFYLSELGLGGETLGTLAEWLQHWQWPDGGWNCDRDPRADTSSFMETLTPMRGLASYGRLALDARSRDAARRAAEVFLRRQMFRRVSDGRVIRPDFLRLHYPLYWHYDVLGGLKVLAEMGRVKDPRCGPALDWLEGRELSGGGWAADAQFYRVSQRFESSSEFVDWGGSRKRTMNPWVTVDALQVLRSAGRLSF